MNLIADLKSFIQSHKNPIIVIMGPTAAGKTALSITIAKALNAEILSTDSRQIYRQMEIGTDAISEEEQDGVAHHMLGIADPDQAITLADYVDQSLKIIQEIYQRQHIPMLVGGTGLYIDAITKNYDIPRVPPNPKLRQELQKIVDNEGPESLHQKLQKLNPEAAQKIHPNNIRYLIRAIEVASTKPIPSSSPSTPKFNTFYIGINRPRQEIYDNIEIRVERQLERGVLDEVKKLLDKGYDLKLPSMSSLGVKEYIPYLKEEMPLEECIRILKRNTRRYAKRQMTWLRRYDNVNWLTPPEIEKIVNSQK